MNLVALNSGRGLDRILSCGKEVSAGVRQEVTGSYLLCHASERCLVILVELNVVTRETKAE